MTKEHWNHRDDNFRKALGIIMTVLDIGLSFRDICLVYFYWIVSRCHEFFMSCDNLKYAEVCLV